MSLRPPEDELDPRLDPAIAADPPPVETLRPTVADSRPPRGVALAIAGACGLGVVTFLFLSAHRTPSTPAQPVDRAGVITPPPPLPADLTATETAARNATVGLVGPALAIPTPPSMSATPGAPATMMTATPPPMTMALPAAVLSNAPGVVGGVTDAAGRKSPTLIVDLSDAPQGAAIATTTAATPAAPVMLVGGGTLATPGSISAATTGAAAAAVTPTTTGSTPAGATTTAAATAARRTGGGLNADEAFAERVGDTEPERARATVIRNTRMTIPQGAMMPGVLETALNSDLPGFARAVISRDVRGFDGSTILIPRGSRVIGQYKSAVSQGQSRAFVIWTRVIRPDGASIQIGSSGTDPLGRAGLDGSVDRHFFERFGGSILLSVINAGTAALSRSPSTQVVIGSSSEATSAGAAALAPQTISPTIKVPQGAPIRIFVARDLDFSPVGPSK